MVAPSLLRVASFRFAALYVAVFTVSTLVLGVTVFLEARSALQRQMTARIRGEVSLLTEMYRIHGLTPLIARVGERGRSATALAYLLENAAGGHLAGNIPAMVGLKPGWTTLAVPHATGDPKGREQIPRLATDLGDGVLLAIGHGQEPIRGARRGDRERPCLDNWHCWALGIVGGMLIGQPFSDTSIRLPARLTPLSRRPRTAGTAARNR